MTESNEHLQAFSDCGHEAARLLPWFVNGTLAAAERERVQEHLRGCPLCTADAEHERRLQGLVSQASTVEHAPQPGLDNLLSRIDELERELPEPAAAAVPIPLARTRRATPVWVPWLATAAAVQTLGLIALGIFVWKQNEQLYAPRFTTLSAPSFALRASEGQIRAVFVPTLPLGELQALLRGAHAGVVSGPSAAGVYTLALTDEHTTVEQALARLRADARVQFAESLLPQAQP